MAGEIERIKALKTERAALVAKVDARVATNAEAKRIVEIDGLMAAILGAMPH